MLGDAVRLTLDDAVGVRAVDALCEAVLVVDAADEVLADAV